LKKSNIHQHDKLKSSSNLASTTTPTANLDIPKNSITKTVTLGDPNPTTTDQASA